MKTAKFYNKRRHYFIRKAFQAKFILKFCGLIILACLLMGCLVYFLSAKTVTTSFQNLRLDVRSTKDFLLPALLLSSLVAIIFISTACVIIVLFVSHRIAGPLYHLEKSMEQIASGDLTVETHLRKNDEAKALAGSLNDLARKLREDIAFMRKEPDLGKIKERLSKYRIE
ncbi:MAG: HAMP domain-containing protein [Candidatus Omnitrophica bacterium]|nr:HAMP domain-containing protein [Candidatus Omnitrophota bacterium]